MRGVGLKGWGVLCLSYNSSKRLVTREVFSAYCPLGTIIVVRGCRPGANRNYLLLELPICPEING